MNDFTSAFGLEQHLSALLKESQDFDSICTPPANVNEAAWLYELVRRMCIEMNWIVLLLGRECSCDVMRASGFEYLCAAHERPQMCSALRYAHHTLDQSVGQLTDSSNYPSRLNVPADGIFRFKSILRRLNRIYNHAYFAHNEAFWELETRKQSYRFFMTVLKMIGETDIMIDLENNIPLILPS